MVVNEGAVPDGHSCCFTGLNANTSDVPARKQYKMELVKKHGASCHSIITMCGLGSLVSYRKKFKFVGGIIYDN